MRLLLDTNVLIWSQTNRARLGEHIAVLQDSDNELLVSAATALEIAIKYRIGKLPLPQPPGAYVPSRIAAIGALSLPVSQAHALATADLPLHHRDPFDRLLIVQAQELGLTLISGDAQLAAYDVDKIIV